jgi:hypothetical protein
MADSPFSNPTIHARIAADVLRIQSTWLEWNAEPTTEDFDTKIVETLVDTLDAHARSYLEAVDGKSRLPEYYKVLRRVGSALIENAGQRSFLSDLYSEDCLRKMAENTGDFISRKHSLTPEQRETEIRNAVERLRSELMPDAMKWSGRTNQLLVRIETRFEARYRHWAAEAIERVQRESKRAVNGTNGTGEDRRAVVDGFLLQCKQETPLKATRTHIWRAVGHTRPRQFQYWQAGQGRLPGTSRGATEEDDRNFRRILAMEPEDFVALLKKKGIA